MKPGTTLLTDGHRSYPRLTDYRHDPRTVGKMAGHVILPWVDPVEILIGTSAPSNTPMPQRTLGMLLACADGRVRMSAFRSWPAALEYRSRFQVRT